MKLPANTKALIFDLDGSLMDSMWVWYAIDVEYLAGHGYERPDDLQDQIGGASMYETALYFKDTFGIRDTPEKMMADWNQMAWDKYTHEVYPKPGAIALLEEAKRRGIPCAIASSNSRELVEQVIYSRGMEEYFAYIITGNEVSHGKPAPDIYLLAAREMGVAPCDCIVFEDIPDGLQAGRSAGMYTVAIYDDASDHQEEKKRQLSDDWIEDFREVSF